AKDIQLGQIGLEKIDRAMQIAAMILGFARGIMVKGFQTAVSAAVRVQHQQDGLCAVQCHGLAQLLQDKLTVTLPVITGQAPGAAGHADRIVMGDTKALDELAQCHLKAMVEAPDNSGVRLVSFPWRLKVKNLANRAPRSAHYIV